MSIQEVSPEQFAQLFHHYNQALADDFRGGDEATASEAWADVPAVERNRMVAAARLALQEAQHNARESRRYFAKPGEAEWGC
jgi:hypothetical protein